jgi:hypothetical protein
VTRLRRAVTGGQRIDVAQVIETTASPTFTEAK